MKVTYSPEDNKIRLYVGRVPRDEYEKLRAAGFVSTPKQDCDFVAVWTPNREDIAREYLDDGDDIGDEDYSPLERAADRAERFAGYLDNRAGEAGELADEYDNGGQAFGHQREQVAARRAARHDRKRTAAISQWSKAEYWQQRTAGVIRNALYKADARVRRSRILTLEAEQRKHEKSRADYAKTWNGWKLVATLPGADVVLPEDSEQWQAAHKLAYTLSCYHGSGWYLDHPNAPEANAACNQLHGHGMSPYDLLTKGEYIRVPMPRLTPSELSEAITAKFRLPDDPDCYSARWSRHYELRLSYERQMLDNEGGTAAAVEIEPGGFVKFGREARHYRLINVDGWAQVVKVNKSPATKRVTSVTVLGSCPYSYASAEDQNKIREIKLSVERLPSDAYRAPSEAEREAFTSSQSVKKAAKPKAPPLINPTPEHAQRLQDYLNALSKRNPTEISTVTQSLFSRMNGGSGSGAITTITIDGVSFKYRVFYRFVGANSVVIITDKPQKPFPIDWDTVTPPATKAAAAS